MSCVVREKAPTFFSSLFTLPVAFEGLTVLVRFARVVVGLSVTSAHFKLGTRATLRLWFAHASLAVSTTDLRKMAIGTFWTSWTVSTALLVALVGCTVGFSSLACTVVAAVFGHKRLAFLVGTSVVFAGSRFALLFRAGHFARCTGAGVASIAFVEGLVVRIGFTVDFTCLGNTLGFGAGNLSILADAGIALVFVGEDLAALVALALIVAGCSFADSTGRA